MTSNGLHTSDMIEIRVPAVAESLALVRLALTGVATAASVPSDTLADLKLAVTEACTNVIEHAYPDGDRLGAGIIVRYTVDHGALTIEVEDHGVGFLPSDVEQRDFDPDGMEGGMGLGILRAITDDVEFASDDNGGRVTFTRQFAQPG